MGRIHGLSGREGVEALAGPEDEIRELQGILQSLRRLIVHRALMAWRRSPETFSEEIVALNDIDQALDNIHGAS